jgi:hypothetical protein
LSRTFASVLDCHFQVQPWNRVRKQPIQFIRRLKVKIRPLLKKRIITMS